MGRISKPQEKAIIDKAVELAYDGISSMEAQKRLYDFSAGIFADGDASFIDVYISIKKAVLTVQSVLEELKEVKNDVEHENSVQKNRRHDSRELVQSNLGFSAEEITRLP